MAEVRNAAIKGNGKITFIKGQKAVPPSVTVAGNETIHDSGSPGIPSYFEVRFTIIFGLEQDSVQYKQVLSVETIVVGERDDSPYRAIESEAARQIAPTLRSVADQIERQVAELHLGHADNAES